MFHFIELPFFYLGTVKQFKMKKRGKTHPAQKQNYSAGQSKKYAGDSNIGKKWYNVVS
jgi:hypothetical protein